MTKSTTPLTASDTPTLDSGRDASSPPPAPSFATLTVRERLLRALRSQAGAGGERADRVPVWLMRQAGRYLPEYQEVRRRYDFLALCKTPEAAAEVSIQPLAAIGSDAVIIFNDILVALEPAGARVAFDDRGPLIHNPVRSAAELTAAVAGGRALEGGAEPVARSIAEVRRRVGGDVPILGFVGAPWTLASYWIEGRPGREFENAAALRWRDPALLEALLDHITPIVGDYLALQIEAGADAVQIFDTWGGLLGSDDFARFSAPYIQRVIERVRPLGAPVIVYVNGCAALLPELAGLGADCVSIDWRLSLARARAALPPAMALQGNLDSRALLAGPDAVRRAVAELFARFPAGPGHVFNLGHGILPATAPESARALVEAVKHYGAY